MADTKFTFIDLFAGIGGMRKALEEIGGECLLTCEIDKWARETYDLNFSNTKKHTYIHDIRDIKSKKLPKYDFLVAGFPCQSFSIAGKRKGLQDQRGKLVLKVIEIIDKTRPKAFLLENVRGLGSHNNGKTLKSILDRLAEIGYTVKYEYVNSATHGNVPQNRDRIIIFGFRSKYSANKFTFPEPIKLNRTIKDVLEQQKVDNRYYYDERFKCFKSIYKAVKSENTVYQWRRKYVRENMSNVCPTLTANMGSGGHNVPIVKTRHGIRKLTPRECASFQGFPKSFKLPEISDTKLYHQFGNSVTVPVIKRVARNMVKVM